jgi:hypothetical protein
MVFWYEEKTLRVFAPMRERLLRSECILFRDSRRRITSLARHIVKRLAMGLSRGG